jgi:hypothetical protein
MSFGKKGRPRVFNKLELWKTENLFNQMEKKAQAAAKKYPHLKTVTKSVIQEQLKKWGQYTSHIQGVGKSHGGHLIFNPQQRSFTMFIGQLAKVFGTRISWKHEGRYYENGSKRHGCKVKISTDNQKEPSVHIRSTDDEALLQKREMEKLFGSSSPPRPEAIKKDSGRVKLHHLIDLHAVASGNLTPDCE